MEHFYSIGIVSGRSMYPTLNGTFHPKTGILRDDIVLVNRNTNDITHGDVIIFRSPDDPDIIHIKRVTGLEGDIIRGQLIPKGYVWVEGDNQRLSHDSRAYGPVSRGLIKGKINYILWPKTRKVPEISSKDLE